MSFDLAVWYPDRRLSSEEAGQRYGRLCEGEVGEVVENPSVLAFHEELTAKHPELDDIPEEKLDDREYCPWSVQMDRSPGHVTMCCVWSRAEYVRHLVGDLARKHGLALYDPQEGAIIYPNGNSGDDAKKPWWRVW
jgi:hypothetical protein